MNVSMNRDELLLALKGQYITKSVESAYCWSQDIPDDEKAELSVEGFIPMTVPISRQVNI